MRQKAINIVVFFIFLSQVTLLAQNNSTLERDAETFTVRGVIVESDTYKPISNVNIQVNGGNYTSSTIAGEFRIKVKLNDEIVISHQDFETVYYTIKDKQSITVEVQPRIFKTGVHSVKTKKNIPFNSLIDSAISYKKISVEKSIRFIEESINRSTSVKQNAEAYEILADVFMHRKQYDLSVTNYKISLNNVKSNSVRLKLGYAYQLNRNYQESILIFNDLKTENLSNWQFTELYEGLGDVYLKIQEYDKSIKAYKEGLALAKKHLITPKITDLNSKIAQAYNDSGAKKKAETYYSNSLNLAAKENKKRAVKEKVKVADFNNANQNYEDEIKLRKEAVSDLRDIKEDSIINNESPLTIQKQNYKIGNAYYMQKDYPNAIPYLEESIKEADLYEDLVVEKDATRKLSEIYDDAGDYKKALKAYKEYTNLVEELNIKKEQEISRATRTNRKIAESQNRIASLETDRKLSISQIELSNEQNKRQKLIIYSLIGGVLLLLFTAFFMFKYIKHQKLANNLLALKSLRSQMNPHFIFNALNSVNSFIATNDERTANRYLTDFSQLMRAVLENSEEDFIPLQKEIELLELYTKLEHFRFQDKFDYDIRVEEDIDVNDFKIPPMLLQPYIENAVWHGLRYKEGKGNLDIVVSKRNDDEIAITIADNGIGRERSKDLKTDNQKKQNSKGMGNIKKRVSILNEMYKDKIDVFIDDFQIEGDKGTKVIVTIKRD